MWPRYETVVQRRMSRWRPSVHWFQCGHGTRPWCNRMPTSPISPWLCFNVATVRDRGATAAALESHARWQVSMWPRYETAVQPRDRCGLCPAPGGFNVATVRDRGATVSAPLAAAQGCRFQCGHGTRPWCNGPRRIREPPSAALSGAASDPLDSTGRVREVARTSSSRGVELGIRAMVGWIHFSRCGGGADGSARAQQRLGRGEAPVAGLEPAGLEALGHLQAAQSLVAPWGGSHVGVAE